MNTDKINARLTNYDISDFDDKMNLKFGTLNILILVYLLSPIAISFICSHAKGNSGLELLRATFVAKEFMYFSLLGTLPILLFLASFLVKKRILLIEQVKSHGRILILLTAISNAIIWTLLLIRSGYKANLFQILSVLFSYLSLLYIFKSKRLQDYFLSRMHNEHKKQNATVDKLK